MSCTPQALCPNCGASQDDLDGIGVIYCPACKWCLHATSEWDTEKGGFVCNLCGHVEPISNLRLGSE